MKRKAGRPKGQKDKVKRKTKRITTAKEEAEIIKDYGAELTNKEICIKHNISESALHALRVRHKIPSKCFDNIGGKSVRYEDLKGKMGIYAISTMRSPRKAYIGSSVNIYKRIQSHISHLNKNRHYNKKLQKDWNNKEFVFHLLEECTEEELLKRETAIIKKLNPAILYNTWNGTDAPEEKYMSQIKQKIMKNVIVKDDGCWESTKNIKRGYCEISYCTKDRNGRADKLKYVKAHRFMYYDATGDWAQLVRHMCDNKACCNPDHLQAGSHRQNLLDRFVEPDKEFEKVWIELGGDPVKITKRLGYKPNCKTVSGPVSASVYEREKKLGLRHRFPELIKKRQGTGNQYGRYSPT